MQEWDIGMGSKYKEKVQMEYKECVRLKRR